MYCIVPYLALNSCRSLLPVYCKMQVSFVYKSAVLISMHTNIIFCQCRRSEPRCNIKTMFFALPWMSFFFSLSVSWVIGRGYWLSLWYICVTDLYFMDQLRNFIHSSIKSLFGLLRGLFKLKRPRCSVGAKIEPRKSGPLVYFFPLQKVVPPGLSTAAEPCWSGRC